MARYFGMRYRYCVVPGCEHVHLGYEVFCWDHTNAFLVLVLFGVESEVASSIYDWWAATEGALRTS